MKITPREEQVLRLIASEMSSEQIAQQLGISVATVETHRHHLFLKLGVKSVVGLIREAMRLGFI